MTNAKTSAGAAAWSNGFAIPSWTWMASRPTANTQESSITNCTSVAGVTYWRRKLIMRSSAEQADESGLTSCRPCAAKGPEQVLERDGRYI